MQILTSNLELILTLSLNCNSIHQENEYQFHAGGFGFKEHCLEPGEKLDLFEYTSLHKPLERIRLYGEEEDQYVITESGQELLHSFIHMLEINYLRGLSSYEDLIPSKLVVNHYGRIELLKGVPLRRASTVSLNKDYFFGAQSIQNVLVSCYGPEVIKQMPQDIALLLKNMMSANSPKGFRMLVHPSLIPWHCRTQAFLDVFHLLFYSMRSTASQPILRDLARVVLRKNKWTTIARSNWLLKQWLDYSDPKAETDEPSYNDGPRSFMWFVRNVESHPLEHNKFVRNMNQEIENMKKKLKYSDDDGMCWLIRGEFPLVMPFEKKLKEYSKDDLRRLIYGKFPLAMPCLYDSLSAANLLKRIHPERNFRFM